MNMDNFDGVFFITIATITIGFLGLVIKYCLKSKCQTFSLCCGLISIDRRVDLELQEEVRRIETGISDTDYSTSPKSGLKIKNPEEIV
jgi:hypothetical protein